jgi:phospholipase/carboxylesterase
MNILTTRLGELSCQVLDALPEGAAPRLLVVLCHGFGAPGTDLVPLAGELLALEPSLAERARFVFPAAPLSLDEHGLYGGRAWWHLDVAQFATAIARGALREEFRKTPEGLPEARRLLTGLVEAVGERTGLAASRVVLGGFSQGSLVATDVALRLPEPPAALCILSGTLVCEDAWRELAGRRGKLPVLQSHGRLDPILPFQGAVGLRELLSGAGLEVDFIEFQGMHTIPLEAMRRMAQVLLSASAAE